MSGRFGSSKVTTRRGGERGVADEPIRLADLAVIGAGPAGTEAAVTAAGFGLDAVLLDEHPAAGGQVYRAAPAAFPPGERGADAAAGNALRERLAASPVEARPRERVWSILARSALAEAGAASPPFSDSPAGALERAGGFPTDPSLRFRLDTLGPKGVRTVFARGLVVCPGTTERVIPFPGWTLPGVIGLAAATVLLKSHRTLPGRRVVVAGGGPLVPAVAAAIVKAGGTVAAAVDTNGPREWVRTLPALVSRPHLLARGTGWVARIAGARVPVHFRQAIRAAEGDRGIEAVTVAPIEPSGGWRDGPGGPSAHRIDADALVVGHGLTPATEIGRLLRLRHRFSRPEGGWCPVTDEWTRTSLPHCYLAGDGAGVRGAAAAIHSGRIAGTAAALDAGLIDPRTAAAKGRRLRRAHAREARVGATMTQLIALRPGMVEMIPEDTIVCRCEDVTRHEIEAAIARGAVEINQLKHFTRCGMGPCQGRTCGEVIAELLAARLATGPDDGRIAAGQWTGRAPLRPVSIDALAGHFDYDDLPIPPPAPL